MLLCILFKWVGIISLCLSLQYPIEITTDLPEILPLEEKIIVTVTIHKGDAMGFAKFSQKLPKGVKAGIVENENGNATFAFTDNTLYFTWLNLPNKDEVTIQYSLEAMGTAPPYATIGGTFEYVEDNVNQSIRMSPTIVYIGERDISKSGKGGMQINRKITPVVGSSNQFKVEIIVEKDEVKGFARLEEVLPTAVKVSEINSQGGKFNFSGQTLSILWLTIPLAEEFEVSYLLEIDSNRSKSETVSGTFSYVVDNQMKEYLIPPSYINKEDYKKKVISPLVMNEHNQKESDSDSAETSSPSVKSIDPQKKKESITDYASDQVNYRVQIAAGHNQLDPHYFRNKFNLQEEIISFRHEGWIKYTFGDYKTYKECRDRLKEVWEENNIRDAFVTAYLNGERITVGEALKLTGQKWSK